MSTINTNGINVNYPVPGQNNSSQGFRDNFTAIKTNLDTAGTEITDLQNKVVLKSALANMTLNNDMANTLISNAATRSFRSTTYNLGNALAGTVIIDASLADVQYGAVGENIVLQFGSWAPTGTQQTIELQLAVSNTLATITFPSAVVSSNNNFGATILENYSNVGNAMTITAPHGVSQLNYKLTTTDCGNSIYIEPLNRPYQSVQVQQRTPSPTGFLGDVAGTMAADANYFYVCTDNFDATTTNLTAISTTTGANVITFTAAVPGNVVANMPVVFDTMSINGNSTTTFGNISAGDVYYVKTVAGANITISDTRANGIAGNTLALSTVTANAGNTSMDATFYTGTNIWKRVSLNNW